MAVCGFTEGAKTLDEAFANDPVKAENARQAVSGYDFETLVAMQEMQSRAFAMQKISLNAANFIYRNIGECPSVDSWEKLSLGTRSMILMLMDQIGKVLGMERN